MTAKETSMCVDDDADRKQAEFADASADPWRPVQAFVRPRA